jgi:hypothetical protein
VLKACVVKSDANESEMSYRAVVKTCSKDEQVDQR